MIGKLQDNIHVRRTVFAAVTLAPIIAIFGLIIQPLRDHFAGQDAQIARQSEILARLKAIAAYRPKPGSAAPTPSTKGEYLTGPNEGVASANLQARLKIIAQTSGAQLRSIQALPAETDGPLRLIGVRLDLAGPLKAVHGVIFAIEDAKPYVFVTEAALKLSREIQRPDGVKTEPVIEARLDVFGAYKAEEAP
jgi:hypothetical protein